MVTEFIEGETYTNPKMERDIMVYAVASETDEEVVMAVGFIDRESVEMGAVGELTVKKEDFKDWDEAHLEMDE